MLKVSSIMVGTDQPQIMADFYTKVLGRNPDMSDTDNAGWSLGGVFFGVGAHSEVKGQSKEPARIILNLETEQINEEFERIKGAGANVVKELYEMEGMAGMWIATFSDPDGNYFQLMTPWKE